MSAENSHNLFGEYLELFAHTEIFIFVFMEIVTKLKTIQRVMFKKAMLKDYVVFTVLFGLFSIFGTYIGITDSSGAISNIRDLAPMVAGLVAGPIVGVSVGMIGGIHRFFLGGVTAIPCAIATILAGLIAGMVYLLLKKKLLGIIPSMLFAVGIELMHGGLALALVQPFSEALRIVEETVPPMIIAVSLGVGISVIILHSTNESTHAPIEKSEPESTPRRVSLPEKAQSGRPRGTGNFTFFGHSRASERKARGKVLSKNP